MDKSTSEKKNVTPKTPEQRSRLKRIFVMVLAVSFILGGVFILQVHRPTETRMDTMSLKPVEPTPPVRPVSLKKMTPAPVADKTVEKPTLLHLPVAEPVIEKNVIEPTSVEMTVPEPAVVAPVTESVAPQKAVLPETLAVHTKLAAGTAKLADLLALRDDFFNNNDCVDTYQKLLVLEPRTTLIQDAVDALMPLCSKPAPVMSAMNHSFLKAKKRAIVAYYKAKYPKWWIVKAIPVSVIEIRRINPVKKRPIDNLYRAQNALLRQDIEQAVRFVNELPPVMRAQMNDFIHEANIYRQARANLDAVILSFEKGE